MLQCLCGPARHAIFGMLYDDESISPKDVRKGMEALIEEDIAKGVLNRRCEICGKSVAEFRYEDRICKEQDWEAAKAKAGLLEAEQMATRTTVMAARKAERN
jgi:hypothetical protein